MATLAAFRKLQSGRAENRLSAVAPDYQTWWMRDETRFKVEQQSNHLDSINPPGMPKAARKDTWKSMSLMLRIELL